MEGDHAWFYETESARRSIAHLNVSSNETVSTRAMVAHDFESTRSEYRTWQDWYRGQTKPGCYDTEDLHACRLAFLDDHISPSVRYSNGELVSLHVQLYKQHIYKTPRFSSSLLRWSEELAHAGFDVPYRGENVAGYTHQVILALIKNRRKKRCPEQSASEYSSYTTTDVHNAVTKATNSTTRLSWTTHAHCERAVTTSSH